MVGEFETIGTGVVVGVPLIVVGLSETPGTGVVVATVVVVALGVVVGLFTQVVDGPLLGAADVDAAAVVVIDGADGEDDGFADADEVAEADVVPISRLSDEELSVGLADTVELDDWPAVEFAVGDVAGECPPSTTYASTATAAIAAAKPAGSTHLRPDPAAPRRPPSGKPFSSKRPARSAMRAANAVPAGSRRLSSTRDRTPGGMNECGSSSNRRSGRRFFTVVLQIEHFSM